MENIKKILKEVEIYIADNFEKENLAAPMCYEMPQIINEVRKTRSLNDVINHLNDTFSQTVFNYIKNKNLDEVDVYNNAHIDRRLFSKIRSNNDFKPSKKTAISLCFGLKLNLDEALDLLEKAGYILSHSSKFDLIVEYFLIKKVYDLIILNQVLIEYNEQPLYI